MVIFAVNPRIWLVLGILFLLALLRRLWRRWRATRRAARLPPVTRPGPGGGG